VIVVAWTGLILAAVTALAQSPPVRGSARGDLRSPSDFSPIELPNVPANASAQPPSRSDQLNQHSLTAGKTPIRRDPAAGDDQRPARTGLGSPWTTLGALAAVLIAVVAATRLLRRWTRDAGDELPSHRFDVLACRRLDAQSSIHLVRIGRRIVALGSSPAGVQPLTVIDDPLEVEELLSGRAIARSEVAGDTVPALFSGAHGIRRGSERPAAAHAVHSGRQGLRRTAAALVSPAEDADA
jgi:flagellar biogenesis protein FliO